MRLKPQDKGVAVTQAELQQDVQRFASEFMFNVAQAAGPLDSSEDAALRHLGLRRVIVYHATALDIATGPYPEVNLVDMLVFVALSRHALERHWVPERMGDTGRPLVEAFAKSERDLWALCNKVLSSEQQAQIDSLIDAWHQAHPNTHLVEGVRFQHFSTRAGEIAAERTAAARGLFGQIRSAAQTADQALLISERALFLAHRMPFMVRMQSRLGAQEVLGDSLQELNNVARVFERVPELHPMLADLVLLSGNAAAAAREARHLARESEPLLEHLVGNGSLNPQAPGTGPAMGADALSRLDRISERSLTMVRELRAALPEDANANLQAVEGRLDALVKRVMIYLLLVGLGWVVLFWAGYALVKR